MPAPSAAIPARSRLKRAAAERMRLDRQLCFALYSTSLAMTKLYKGALAPLGLTYPQYLVMLALWEHGELAVGDIGERLCLDSGTLTPLLKRMQAAGWLSRTRAPDDERRVRVCLSAAGEALRAQGALIPLRIGAASGLSAAAIGALTQELQRLRDRLQSTAAASPVGDPATATATAFHPDTVPARAASARAAPRRRTSTPS